MNTHFSKLVLFCLSVFLNPVAEASLADVAVMARTAFDEGDFAKAAKHYDELMDREIVNGHLYYNAGLAHYRLGETGKALAAFLAARSLLPRDPDVRANIASVTLEIENKLDASPRRAMVESVAFWIPLMTQRELILTTTVAAALVGGLLWLTLLAPKLSGLRPYAWWALVIPLLGLTSVIIKGEVQQVWGAVTAEETAAFSGPGTGHTLLFELGTGAPFRVLDDSDEWLKVELSGGKKGWLARQDLIVYRQF